MNINEEINRIKEKLKDRLVIPVHHYQNAEVSRIADFLGDSYKLAVECGNSKAEFIVFCGVLFMAESADILKKDYQKVVIPAINADCPMANMANLSKVNEIYCKITAVAGDVVPVVYMNSYADLKAFCGEHGGTVCTSSNAHIIVDYYFKQGRKVLFFPDANLGINTGLKLGLSHKDMIKTVDIDKYNNEKLIVWNGFCPVHKRFTPGDIGVLKNNYPGIQIIVHPECPEEVTSLADKIGSTEYILNTIAESPSGSIWGVGTETVFVDKIAAEYPNKTIVGLKSSECVNMKKTTEELVLQTLRNIENHIDKDEELKNQIIVPEEYRENAYIALKRMIEITSSGKK